MMEGPDDFWSASTVSVVVIHEGADLSCNVLQNAKGHTQHYNLCSQVTLIVFAAKTLQKYIYPKLEMQNFVLSESSMVSKMRYIFASHFSNFHKNLQAPILLDEERFAAQQHFICQGYFENVRVSKILVIYLLRSLPESHLYHIQACLCYALHNNVVPK